ncbi:hypothetical protein GJ496_004231 [Pomphorhynchus laevis]|nr:hypothetical protein GJ496_004231 [Pomphorhynchus laevis]
MIQKLLLRNCRNTAAVVNFSVNSTGRSRLIINSKSTELCTRIAQQNLCIQCSEHSTIRGSAYNSIFVRHSHSDAKSDETKLVDPSKRSKENSIQPVVETRWQRIKAECKHYYHGFRLFFVEFKIAARLLVKVFFGKQLSRREKRHFTRTAADLFRIVPFAVFIVVPFMEFLIPFYLKFFPGMLPSTFKVKSKQEEKLRKQMRVKLQVARFLQDTLEETALHSKNQGSPDDIKAFTDFMRAVRSGRQPTNEEILKFAALLEDELTLESLNHLQLVCLCQLLNLSSVGPDYMLRLQIQLRLRLLHADDKVNCLI